MLIYDLLDNPYFEEYLDYDRTHFNMDKFSDFMDGELARGHLQDMKRKGDEWKKSVFSPQENVKCVNILFSTFYDDGQVFKSKCTDFWPLAFGIENVPPHLRGKIGLSYFLIALYTGKHKEVERTIFSDFISEELRQLYIGIMHVANGKTYFIQARLVVHIYDTKAAEPLLGFQSTGNSKFGCPLCGGITGIHNGSKCVMLGHRGYLPQENFLRFFGQTGKCCPTGFYDSAQIKQWYVPEHFLNTEGEYSTFCFENHETVQNFRNKVADDNSDIRRVAVEKHLKTENIDTLFDPCDGNPETKDNLIQFIFHDLIQYQWYHDGEFELNEVRNLFKDFLFYRHQDFRTTKKYKRQGHLDYLESSMTAETTNVITKGLKSRWYWYRLQYGDIETQFSWPVAHSISGTVVRIVQLIIGNSFETEKEKEKKKKKRRTRKPKKGELESQIADQPNCISNPSVFRPSYEKGEAPWAATKSNVQKVQAWFDCILLPPGLRDDWTIDLTCPTSMRMDQKLHLITCYWNFVIQSLDIHRAFKKFFRMFGYDICLLTSLSIEKNKVLNLQNCVNETVGTWEGMLPTNSMRFQLHEIVDLPNQIKYFGPLMANSEMAGERFLGKLIDLRLDANNGGRESHLKTVISRQIAIEMRAMKLQYQSLPSSDKPNTLLWYNTATQRIVYNELPFTLSKLEKNVDPLVFNLSSFELEVLIHTLLQEVLKRFKSDSNECQKSPLYRIFYSNSELLPRKEWIDTLKNMRTTFLTQEKTGEEYLVANNLLNFQPNFHRNAIIYGIKFSSRGAACRETVLHVGNDHDPFNKNCSWSELRAYRSWCKFDIYNAGDSQFSTYYGLVNSYFSVEKLGDSILNGLLLASVTSFAFNISPCAVETIETKGAFQAQTLFVALQDIAPTLIASIPFFITEDGTHKSISLQAATAPTQKNNKYTMMRCENLEIFPHYFVMFLLNPNRLTSQPFVGQRSFCNFMF
jgi:hypothetical protein